MEEKIYQILKKHKLPLKKREELIIDLLDLFSVINIGLPELEEKTAVRTKKNCTDCDFNISNQCKITGLIISKEFAEKRCGQHSHYL